MKKFVIGLMAGILGVGLGIAGSNYFYGKIIREKAEKINKFKLLTDREKEVLREVARGKLNKQIAIDLNIAEQTVKIHRGNAMHKLGLRSALDASAFLLDIGRLGKNE